MLVTPEHGRTHRRGETRGYLFLRFARGDVHGVGVVLSRIHHDELAVSGTGRIHAPTRVHSGIILVRGSQIVHESFVTAHVPQGQHQIALDAFRPGRRRRHGPFSDTFRPGGVDFQGRFLALNVQHTVHRSAAHSRAETPLPGLCVRLEFRLRFEDMIHFASLLVPKLMAEIAVGLERVDPMVLGKHFPPHPVALRSGAREQALVRRRQQ
jgi:hypothetical protein